VAKNKTMTKVVVILKATCIVETLEDCVTFKEAIDDVSETLDECSDVEVLACNFQQIEVLPDEAMPKAAPAGTNGTGPAATVPATTEPDRKAINL
jgi:hypothetical protein